MDLELGTVVALVLCTAVSSSVITAILAAVLLRWRLQPTLERRLTELGEELEARVRSGVLGAGEELAPKFRAEVEQGFRDGVLAIASGQDLDDSVRAFAKGSVDLIGGGLNSLLGRSRRKD